MKNRSITFSLMLAILGSMLSMNAAESNSTSTQAHEALKKIKMIFTAKIQCSNDERCDELVSQYIKKFGFNELTGFVQEAGKGKIAECKNFKKEFQGAGVEATITEEILARVNDTNMKDIASEDALLALKCAKENVTYKYKSSGKVSDECMECCKKGLPFLMYLTTSGSTSAAQLCRNNGMSNNAIIDIECTELSITPVVE